MDWDGTAVARRNVDAFDLADGIGRLLERGIPVGIAAGTHAGHIEHQLVRHLPSGRLHNLYLLVNRGSEVQAYPSGRQMERIFLRRATELESGALDRTADRLQQELRERFGLDCPVVRDRLNRRKIDLIALPEWSDPPKSEIGRLFGALEDRLRSARVPSLRWLVERARELAIESGIPDPRITTDLKYIEIGLTDKSDSARWFASNVLHSRRIAPESTLLLGDEFGGPEGVTASDAFLRIPELSESAAVSVGVEPFGVPDGVFHAGGGPEAVVDLLDFQLASRGWGISSDPSWCVEQESFDPSREREMETLFVVGNGSLGVRGALDIGIPGSEADLFLAGIYDAKSPVLPYSELEFLTPERKDQPFTELASFPFPFRLRLRVEGRTVELQEDLDHRAARKLDLGAAILEISQDIQLGSRRIEVRSRRLASLEDLGLMIQEVELRAHGGAIDLELEAGIDFAEFHLRHPHLLLIHPAGEPAWSVRGHTDLSEIVLMETRQSRFLAGLAVRAEVDGAPLSGRGWSGRLVDQGVMRLRRLVSVLTSRDERFGRKPPSLEEFLQGLVGDAQRRSFPELHRTIGTHRRRWSEFWRQADIPFSLSPGLTESQRFNAYHLRISAPNQAMSSIPARTLSGRGYEGHVFWDAEVFMLPFFVLQFPEFARRILEYRHMTLGGARKRARAMACRGACFAWESTVDGQDVTPDRILLRSNGIEIPIYTGSQQIHVTADVAYAVWQYWFCTGDAEFMESRGAEILFETARFWASRCSLVDGRYHIEGVVGPDEYHHNVRDNAYTNWMARFNVERALWARDWMRENNPEAFARLSAQIGLFEEEVLHWTLVARQLFVPVPGSDGVIEQFEGFFGLEKVALSTRERLKPPVRRLLDWQKVNRLKICKQADVLMLPFLFPASFSPEVVRANYDYYEPITDHGSSLSPPVHACVAAMAGRTEHAIAYYSQAVELDLFNRMQNTSLGIHAACMAGSWQALLFGLMGIRLTEHGPVPPKNGPPAISKDWGTIRCRLVFRGESRELEVSAA